MTNRFERTERLLGHEAMARLRHARVAVFGLGGVGSSCAEALARSGLGYLRIVDHDAVADSNCNRQLHAMSSTLGRPKTEVMKERLQDINPRIELDARHQFFAADTADQLLDGQLDAVVDAIDAMGPKIELLARCQTMGLRVVTVLGAAARLDPTQVRLVPLAKTNIDPFAARVRKMLRRRGSLDGVMAVYSTEPARPTQDEWPALTNDLVRGRQRIILPSMMMVPATMGLTAASFVVRSLTGLEG